MKNYSWKRRLFLSYIFIGVIPILVLGAFFYYGNRQSSKQETERNNLAQMSQVLQKMDYITEKMNNAAYHFPVQIWKRNCVRSEITGRLWMTAT